MRVKTDSGRRVSREYVYMRKDERRRRRTRGSRRKTTRRRGTREEARQQMEREDSRYLSVAHQPARRHRTSWSGAVQSAALATATTRTTCIGMCHTCGARRTERHRQGRHCRHTARRGGRGQSHSQQQRSQPQSQREDSGKVDDKQKCPQE